VSHSTITVVRGSLPLPLPSAGERVVTDDEFRSWVLDGRIVRHLRRYDTGRLVTERLATSGRPMLAWALRLVTRGRCAIVDTDGQERDLTVPLLIRWSCQVALEAGLKGNVLRKAEREVAALEGRSAKVAERVAAPPAGGRYHPAGLIVYLRTDMSFGIRAGGSVGHIAGVLNELRRAGHRPILITTAAVPTVSEDIETREVAVPERFWNFRELPTLVLNDVIHEAGRQAIADKPARFIYQRYSLNNYAGLKLARDLGVPFILEYNGSEVWMSRHWSRALRYEPIAERIELLNVTGADLVVVVSRAMRDELVNRGVPDRRILMNPNAVDPERYRPDVDGASIRARYGLGDKTVVGFISTFQPWHGAEVLARAFEKLMRDCPAYRNRVHLLMIGSGAGLTGTRQIIAGAGLDLAVTFTGLVEQEHGPEFLAACDLLVSPHVPNADGSPFFGSPTKLFEYMAMGRGIVASNLDQIGEILRHGETALLVPPADAGALASAIAQLVDDRALRETLGRAARREAVARHTWRAHVGRTLAALDGRLHAASA
jgi:glycosyltransferase involved in cell wall biosynthesis